MMTVSDQHVNFRTIKDINSHRVIVSHDCVFLADDYDVGTVGDTFSFEIKVSI